MAGLKFWFDVEVNSPSPHHSKWRRFVRKNRELLVVAIILCFVLAAVVLLFWVLTSSRFIKS